jgi:hypothetical protein
MRFAGRFSVSGESQGYVDGVFTRRQRSSRIPMLSEALRKKVFDFAQGVS